MCFKLNIRNFMFHSNIYDAIKEALVDINDSLILTN